MPTPTPSPADFVTTASDIDKLLGDGGLDGLSRETLQATGLPGKAYGATFYEIEQRALFPKIWCAAGVASDLPNPGDMRPSNIAGWPVLLLRDDAGELKAFHNICRHRAMALVTEPCNQKAIMCPWHAWRYGLDGSLLRTPRVGGDANHTQQGLNLDTLGLVPIRLARWHDMMFVNIDGKADDFETHIAPLNELLANYDLSGLRRANSWEIEYPGNWKVAVEGAIEDYHLPIGHPQIAQAALRMSPVLDFASPVFYSNSTRREYARPEDENPAAGGHPAIPFNLPSIPFAADDAQRRTFFMNVFPTGMFQMHRNNAVQGLFLPVGPERTRLVFHHYYMGDAADAPDLEAERAVVTREWLKVFEQDIPFVHHVHQNYLIRDAAGIDTRFSEVWEANIHEFQKTVVDVIRR